MRLLGAALVAALVIAHAALAGAEWTLDAEGALVYETNLSRAAREADRHDGIALAPGLTIGHYLQLTDAIALETAADLKGRIYPEFDGLSHVAPTLTLGVRGKLGLGAYAPWLRGFVAGGALLHGDDVRDGVLFETGVHAGKRLTERFSVQGGYAYESIDAHNDVFNGDAHTVSVRATAGLTADLQLIAGYALRWGDLVIHRAPVAGAPPAPHTRVVDTFDTPLVAARIDATTHLFSAALAYALTQKATLSLGYEYQLSFGPEFSYPNHVVRASVGWSF